MPRPESSHRILSAFHRVACLQRFSVFPATIAGALILMSAAYFNGYPIVYSDSATYLSSGFQLETPFDRPITYGLFIRLTSLNGLTLWTVVFCQALLLSWLFSAISKWLIGRRSIKLQLGVITFLSATTSVSWIVSQLMPDGFTPILLLSFVLLVGSGINGRERMAVYAVFLLSCSMHISHLMFCAGLILSGSIVQLARSSWKWQWSRMKPLAIMALLTGLSALTMGAALEKSRPIYLMGAMAEHGILKTFLDEHCPGEYKLCALKDSLPERAYEFVWDHDGPVARLGGWKAVHDEFNSIIAETFTDPKYVGLHLRASASATGDQLVRFDIGDGWGVFGTGTELERRLAVYVPRDQKDFLNSRQNTSRLTVVPTMKSVHRWVIISSILLAVVIWIFPNDRPSRLRFLMMVLVGILLNAWVSGTFANAIDRLGAKMIWLLPFAVLILLVQLRPPRAADQ